MNTSREELLGELQRAYEIEEIMAGLLTDLVISHVSTPGISRPDMQKVRRMLSIIRADTHKHQKIVSGMLKRFSEGSFGIRPRT